MAVVKSDITYSGEISSIAWNATPESYRITDSKVFNDLLQTHTAPLFWSSQILRISERAVLKLPCLPSQKGETLEVSVVILRARHSQHFHTI